MVQIVYERDGQQATTQTVTVSLSDLTAVA